MKRTLSKVLLAPVVLFVALELLFHFSHLDSFLLSFGVFVLNLISATFIRESDGTIEINHETCSIHLSKGVDEINQKKVVLLNVVDENGKEGTDE